MVLAITLSRPPNQKRYPKCNSERWSKQRSAAIGSVAPLLMFAVKIIVPDGCVWIVCVSSSVMLKQLSYWMGQKIGCAL